MKTLLLNTFYTYNPDEFLPVWSGTELINKNEYLYYKARKVVKNARKCVRMPNKFDWKAPFRHWYCNAKYGHWYNNGL
jgi:hypothetical protein